jgi:hypothetical protein
MVGTKLKFSQLSKVLHLKHHVSYKKMPVFQTVTAMCSSMKHNVFIHKYRKCFSARRMRRASIPILREILLFFSTYKILVIPGNQTIYNNQIAA